nr:hypothetical protein [Tanacetum cinerariifolium]
MQRLLPYRLQNYLPDKIAKPIIELCSLFKQICSATLMEDDMLKAQIKLVDILCDLKLIYPPALFDIMIHLVIHLPIEALEGGPILPVDMLPRNLIVPTIIWIPLSQRVSFRCSDRPEIDTYRSQFKSLFPNKDMKEEFPDCGICSPRHDGEMFYGQLQEILEFKYLLFKVVLFRVKWFDTRNKGRKVKRLVLRNNMTQIDTRAESFKDDQYILVTQIKQIFYLEDKAKPYWRVVEHVNHKKFSDGGVIVEMTWHATGKCTEPEPRNVRLGLAANGFNLFGKLSQSYSMWPVILTTNNLPPCLCMKESYFMLTLLIPGPKSPSKDTDVYLRPLIDDLKVLCANLGVETIDVATGLKFNMRAMVLSTINDFPVWSGQGYKACPICNEDTPSVHVLGKTAYVGHRRFLNKPQKWMRSLEFNGESKNRDPPREFSRDAIMTQLTRLPTRVKDKHPRKKFCQFIKGVKLLDGFGSNFKHKVTDNDTNITGVKSHDCHIMMQRLLPYGLQQYLAPDVAKPLIELCLFFKQICSQTLMVDDMLKAQSKLQVFKSLCKSIGLRSVIRIDHQELKKVIWYVLHNSPEIDTYQAKFKIEFPNKDMKEEFPGWFEKQTMTQVLTKAVSYSLWLVDHHRLQYQSTLALSMVIEHVSHKKFLNGGVIVVEDDPDVIHVDNSSDLALSTSLNDLEVTALHIDGQPIDVDAPLDIIDVVDEDDDIIDEEDPIPHDLADSDDEDLVNLDINDGVNMSTDVAQGHGGNGGGDDHPPPYQGTRKPNLGGRRAGRLYTRQETRKLGLKTITDKSGPVPIQFEVDDRETLMPLSDHTAHWANYLGELVRELPLHYPSWRQMPPERKAGIMAKIGFDLRPHMESDRWPQIYAGIQQHLQKIYNGKKTSLKQRYWVPEEDGSYDLEGIRGARPSHISEADWDAQLAYWNDPKNLARAAQNKQNRAKSKVVCRQ